jgi:hypothetical protein
MLVVQFDAEHRPGQHGLDATFNFYVFFHVSRIILSDALPPSDKNFTVK